MAAPLEQVPRRGSPRGREIAALVHAQSLSQTLDAVSAALFEQQALSAADRAAVAAWIAARQGLPGAYADTFAGFSDEQQRGIVVFTGERITSASARHILGEEACRVLWQLGVQESRVRAALEAASAGLAACLARAANDPRNTNPGRFCCGKCTVGLWRHLLAGGLDRREERLRRGVRHLQDVRDGEGGWRAFPYWYTVLALSELDLPEARRELRYASPVLERTSARKRGRTVYAQRRHELARRTLEKL